MSHLDELMAEVAATQRGALDHLDLEPELARRIEAATRPAPIKRASLGLALAGLAVAGAVLWLRGAPWLGGSPRGKTEQAVAPVPAERALAFVVTGAGPRAGQVGEILEASVEQPLAATFSDGSEVVVAAGARARVVALEAQGASIALDRGQVDVHVVHRATTHWQVTAGAYRIRVTGTRFAAQLPASGDALVVRLTEGSVEVTGPAGMSNVSAGHELHAGPSGWVLDPAPSPVKSVRHADAGPTPSELPRVDAALAPARNWRALAKRARYDEALAAAVASDFGAACGGSSATDVMLLGDVARLAGDVGRAEQAYSRALVRFPKLDRPAFALGVMSFEARRDYRAATTWFARYLREHPAGPLATEASGRLLESLQRGGETARARAVATTYLQQHPDGAHAALARSLVEAP